MSPIVPPVDGVIGSVSQTPAETSSKQKLVLNLTPNSSSQNPTGPVKSSEVHAVQSNAMEKSSKGKKKGKGKLKPMPQNRVIQNCLLANLYNGNLGIPA